MALVALVWDAAYEVEGSRLVELKNGVAAMQCLDRVVLVACVVVCFVHY